jgi:hypothetical protein
VIFSVEYIKLLTTCAAEFYPQFEIPIREREERTRKPADLSTTLQYETNDAELLTDVSY